MLNDVVCVFKQYLMQSEHIFPSIQRNFWILPCMCLCSLTDTTRSRSSNSHHSRPVRITSDSTIRAYSSSSEPNTAASGQPSVSWLPSAPPEQEVALIQRDATCPWWLADPINPQWYVACTGNFADRNSMLTTVSYLIHWPSSDARLVLLKWLWEIRLRKATISSDSSLSWLVDIKISPLHSSWHCSK